MSEQIWTQHYQPESQEMRPYVPGEDLTGITVSDGDSTEGGGWIARNKDDDSDRWFVPTLFYDANYSAIPDDWFSRLIEEEAQLADKCTKLSSFHWTPGFMELPKGERSDLCSQLALMIAYRDVLKARIGRAEAAA
jgi:hypothetical protein